MLGATNVTIKKTLRVKLLTRKAKKKKEKIEKEKDKKQ